MEELNLEKSEVKCKALDLMKKNPTIYEVMTELDNPRNKNSGGVTFNDFYKTVNYIVQEKEITEDLRRVFTLFLDDPNSNITSLESIKRVADELGEKH